MSSRFAFAKATELEQEAEGWGAPFQLEGLRIAIPGKDISLIDVGICNIPKGERTVEQQEVLLQTGKQLRSSCEKVGFNYIKNHGVNSELIRRIFKMAKSYHNLPEAEKLKDEAVNGAGYLPFNHKKLPRRAKGNLNSSFLIKQNEFVSIDHMPWPKLNENGMTKYDFDPTEFRNVMKLYVKEMENLSLKLIPLYAIALGLPEDYFDGAFEKPTMRLRLSHYPNISLPTDQVKHGKGKAAFDGQFGIAPHVDTTFFTILASSGPGLVVGINEDVKNESSKLEWVRIPHVEGSLLVNTGQLLKQITNDTWVAARHYALNPTPANIIPDDDIDGNDECQIKDQDGRFSIPFFFNATASHKLPVVHTCCSPENPAKYPPLSYMDSQSIAQGE